MPTGQFTFGRWRGLNWTVPPDRIGDDELVWARNLYPITPGRPKSRPVVSVIGNAAIHEDYFSDPSWVTVNTPSPVTAASDPTSFPEQPPMAQLWAFRGTSGKVFTVLGANAKGLNTNGVNALGWSFWVAGDVDRGQWFIANDPGMSTNVGGNISSGTASPPSSVVWQGFKWEWPPNRLEVPDGFAWRNSLFVCSRVGGLLVMNEEVQRSVTIAGPVQLPPRPLMRTWQVLWNSQDMKPGTGCAHLNRLILAGFEGQNEGVVLFGDPDPSIPGIPHGGPGTALQVGAYSAALIGRGDGERVIAVRSSTVFGGAVAVEPYVVVFKERSVWLIQGDLPTSAATDFPDMKVAKILTEGLVDLQSLVETPFGWVWCSGKNVWLLPPGGQPVPIGSKIAPQLEQLPQTAGSWVGAWDARLQCYRLSMPWAPAYWTQSQSATPLTPWLGTKAGPTSVGREGVQLWCDLRPKDEAEGRPEPQWWGPQDLPVLAMLNYRQAGSGDQLMGVMCVWAVESGTLVPRYVAVELNGSEGDHLDMSGWSWGPSDLVAEPKTNRVELATKQFDLGDPQRLKIWGLVDLESMTESLDLDLDVETEAARLPLSRVNETAASPAGNFPLDGTTNLTTEGQLLSARPRVEAWGRVSRVVGRKGQVKIFTHYSSVSGDSRGRVEFYSINLRVRLIGRRADSKRAL